MSQHSVEFDLFKDELVNGDDNCMNDVIIEGKANDRLNILKDYLSALQEFKYQVRVFASSSQSQTSSSTNQIVDDSIHQIIPSSPSNIHQELITPIQKPKRFVIISKLIYPNEYKLNHTNSFTDLTIQARVRIPLHQIIAKYQIKNKNMVQIPFTNFTSLRFHDISLEYLSYQRDVSEEKTEQLNIVIMDCSEDVISIHESIQDKTPIVQVEEVEMKENCSHHHSSSSHNREEVVEKQHNDDTIQIEKKEEAFVDINCDCGICLLPLYDDTQIYNLESCNHAFHLACVHRCMESRNIQKNCVKCFKEISLDEQKHIKLLFKEDVRTKRLEKRLANNPKPKEKPKKVKTKPKVHEPTFEPPSTPHKINHNLIIEEYGYMLTDHSELPLNYKCKSYLPAFKRSDKPIELICTITLNPNFGKDPHVFLLRIESSVLERSIKSFTFEELTELLKEQLEEKTSKRIENAKEYFGLKNKKVTTVIDKIRDCEFFYRNATEIRENSFVFNSPVMIGKSKNEVEVLPATTDTSNLKRKEPPKEPTLDYIPLKKRKFDPVPPFALINNQFLDVSIAFETGSSAIDMMISYLENNYGIQATRSVLRGLAAYSLEENDCAVVAKLYLLLQHYDFSCSRGIHSLYDVFKESDVKLDSIIDLYDILSQSVNTIPNDIIHKYAKQVKELNRTTISLIHIASKFLIPKYSEDEIIEACINIIEMSNTFFASLDPNITISSRCEHEIVYGLFNVVKSIDYFIVENVDFQTVLLNLITIIEHIESTGIEGIKECLSNILDEDNNNNENEMAIDYVSEKEKEESNSNEVMEDIAVDINVDMIEIQMEDLPEEQFNPEIIPPSFNDSPNESQHSSFKIPKEIPKVIPETQSSKSIQSFVKKQEPISISDLSSIAECSIEEKEMVKNISQQLSQLSSIHLSNPQTKLIVVPHSQESFPIDFSNHDDKEEIISLSLSSFESEKVPSIFPYFD